MRKSILLSIKPEHALNILNGIKTLELRKSVPKGFKGWVYVYVTKAKPYLYMNDTLMQTNERFYVSDIKDSTDDIQFLLNGTIPFRFWFDEYDVIEVDSEHYRAISDKVCLTLDDIIEYCNGKDLYAWQIKKTEIFDKPMELSEFYTWNDSYDICPFAMSLSEEYMTSEEILINRGCKILTKAPQSWQYVYTREELK